MKTALAKICCICKDDLESETTHLNKRTGVFEKEEKGYATTKKGEIICDCCLLTKGHN